MKPTNRKRSVVGELKLQGEENFKEENSVNIPKEKREYCIHEIRKGC